MSSGERRDLDALLRGWPALDARGAPLPDEADAVWEKRADAIVAAAKASRVVARDGGDDLLAAPSLAAEPGEVTAGEKRMSSPSDSGGGKSQPPKPRQSLKEMAQRASQSVRPPLPSSPATSTPLPATPAPPVIRTSQPEVARGAEASASDSGVVNLKAVNENATPAQVAAAAKAKPGTSSLFEDDGEGKAKPAAVAAAKPAPAPAAEKKSGATTGIIVAVFGIAAAFAVWQFRSKPTTPAPVASASAPAAQPEKTAAAVAPAATASAVAQAAGSGAPAEPLGLDPSNLPDDKAAPTGAPLAGRLPTGNAAPKASAVAVAAAPIGTAGDLKTEMRRAVGADGKPIAAAAEPEPAAGDTRSKTLPERPSQGAVQSAIGAVLGGAKACVAGADEPTRATVTFASSGAVSNVSVTGWASSNGKSSCVVGALKGAKVGAFTSDRYSFPVTIKP